MGRSGEKITIFLSKNMSEKFKEVVDKKISSQQINAIFAAKMAEDGFFKFTGFCNKKQIGIKSKAMKAIAYENLQRTLEEGVNTVRAKNTGQKLVIGRAGLTTYARTGNRISNALAISVDRTKEFAAKAEKLRIKRVEKEKNKALIKLRREYFYEREFHPLLSDKEWDALLIFNYGETIEPEIQSDAEFEAKLREAGL